MPDNTPLSDAEVEKYVREIAAQEAAKLNKTPESPAEPAQLTLNIGGKEMTFKDSQEASAQLTSLYEQTARQTQPQPQGRQVTSDEGPSWTPEDQSAYVDMLVKNPIKAQEYIDQKRFGVTNPTEFIRQGLQATAHLTTQHTIDQFVASHPDYHVSPENAATMQGVLTELGGGKPVVNPMALEAAYAIADKRGLIKRPAASPPAYNPYLAAPPVASRTSGQMPSNFERDVESMTPEQIEALMHRMS